MKVRTAIAVSLAVSVASLLAACADDDDGDGNGSAELGLDPGIERELRAVVEDEGFDVRVPTHLPTGADDLVHIEGQPLAPPGQENGPPAVLLVYKGDETRTVDGVEVVVRLGVSVLDEAAGRPMGELVGEDIAGFEVYRDIVSEDDDGEPTAAIYTALDDDGMLLFDFTLDVPGKEDFAQTLESLTTVSP